VTRRGILKFVAGAPTIAAASAPAPDLSHDAAVLHLAACFSADAAAMAGAGAIDEPLLLARLARYAEAMTLFAARDPLAIAAKRRVAAWSLDRGAYRIGLSTSLSADLVASAESDRAGLPL
jgi:hypothetical protein